MAHKISTPSSTKDLKWNPAFGGKMSSSFDKAQAIVDSEVLRLSDPLTPKQTGNLINSGKTGTTIGSGLVQYTAVYAKVQYYSKHYDHSQNKNPQGGALWFERMKAANKSDILKKASTAF